MAGKSTDNRKWSSICSLQLYRQFLKSNFYRTNLKQTAPPSIISMVCALIERSSRPFSALEVVQSYNCKKILLKTCILLYKWLAHTSLCGIFLCVSIKISKARFAKSALLTVSPRIKQVWLSLFSEFAFSAEKKKNKQNISKLSLYHPQISTYTTDPCRSSFVILENSL